MAGKRKSFDLKAKMRIIADCESGECSKSEIARRFGINTSTLFTILKKKEQIRAAMLKGGRPSTLKHLRPGEHP